MSEMLSSSRAAGEGPLGQPTLSLEERDTLILELYGIAHRVAEEWAAPQRRDDLVHDFIVRCLDALHDGEWVTPTISLDRFVEISILVAKSNGLRSRATDAKRDYWYLSMLEAVPREWMSQDLDAAEKQLREFAAEVRRSLPQRAVRAHLLHRDDGLTYAQVGRKMGITVREAHAAISSVHARFRAELPKVEIEPPASEHGGRPRRSSRRRSVSNKRAA